MEDGWGGTRGRWGHPRRYATGSQPAVPRPLPGHRAGLGVMGIGVDWGDEMKRKVAGKDGEKGRKK